MAPDRIFSICFLTLLVLISFINAFPNQIGSDANSNNREIIKNVTPDMNFRDITPINYFTKKIRTKRDDEETNKECENIKSKAYEDVFKIILPLITLKKPVPPRDLIILLNIVFIPLLTDDRKSIEDYLSSPDLSDTLKKEYELYYKQISDDEVKDMNKALHLNIDLDGKSEKKRKAHDEEKPNTDDDDNQERGEQEAAENPENTTPSEEQSRGEEDAETTVHPSGTEKERGEDEETTTVAQNERGEDNETTTSNPDEKKERGEEESDTANTEKPAGRSEEDESESGVDADEEGNPLKRNRYRSRNYLYPNRYRRPKWKLGYGRPLKDLSQYKGSRIPVKPPSYGQEIWKRPNGYFNKWNVTRFDRQRRRRPGQPPQQLQLPPITEFTTQKTVSYDFSLQGGDGSYIKHPVINQTEHKFIPEVNVVNSYLKPNRLRRKKKYYNEDQFNEQPDDYLDQKYYKKRKEFKDYPDVNVISPYKDRFKKKKTPHFVRNDYKGFYSQKNETVIKTLPISPESIKVFKQLFIKGILKVRPFHQLMRLPVEIISKLKYEPNLLSLLATILKKIGKQPQKMLETLFKSQNDREQNLKKKLYQVEKELFDAIENINKNEIIYKKNSYPNFLKNPEDEETAIKKYKNKLKYKQENEDILNQQESFGEINTDEDIFGFDNENDNDFDNENMKEVNPESEIDDNSFEESKPYKNGIKVDIDEEDILMENVPDENIEENDSDLYEIDHFHNQNPEDNYDNPDNIDKNNEDLNEDDLIISEISKNKTKIDIDEEDELSHNESDGNEDDNDEEQSIEENGESNPEEIQPNVEENEPNDDSDMEENETYKNGVKIDIDEEDILMENAPDDLPEGDNEPNENIEENESESEDVNDSESETTDNPEGSENNTEESDLEEISKSHSETKIDIDEEDSLSEQKIDDDDNSDDGNEENANSEENTDSEPEETNPDSESEETSPDSESEETTDSESEETNPDSESEETNPDSESEETNPDSESEETNTENETKTDEEDSSVQEKSIPDEDDDDDINHINNILLSVPKHKNIYDNTIIRSNRGATNFGITYEDIVETKTISNDSYIVPEKPSQMKQRKQIQPRLDSKQIQKGGSKNGVELIYEDSVITRKRPSKEVEYPDEYDNDMYDDYKTVKDMINKPNTSSNENFEASNVKNAHNKAKIELIYEDALHVVTKKRNDIKDFDDLDSDENNNDNFLKPQKKRNTTPLQTGFNYGVQERPEIDYSKLYIQKRDLMIPDNGKVKLTREIKKHQSTNPDNVNDKLTRDIDNEFEDLTENDFIEDEDEHFQLTYEDKLLVKHHNKELGNKLIPIQKWVKRNQPQKRKESPENKRVFKRDSPNKDINIAENNFKKNSYYTKPLYRSSMPLLLRKKTRKMTKPGVVTSLNPKNYRYRDISPEYYELNQMENIGIVVEETENLVDHNNGINTKNNYPYNIIEETETEMKNDYNPLEISIEFENGDEDEIPLNESQIKIII